MRSTSSTSQLPKGTSCLTHSTLRTPHDRLVGCSIQTVYEAIAHNSTTRKGAAIKMRRRRRLRLTAGPPSSSPPAEPLTGDAGESAASGGALTPEPEPDRHRRFIDHVLASTEQDTDNKMIGRRRAQRRGASGAHGAVKRRQ